MILSYELGGCTHESTLDAASPLMELISREMNIELFGRQPEDSTQGQEMILEGQIEPGFSII